MGLDYAFPGGKFDAVHDCYINKDDINLQTSFEMVQFRKQSFEDIFTEQCFGKNKCAVTYKYSDFARLPAEAQRLNMVLSTQVECT